MIRPPNSNFIGGPEAVKILRSEVYWLGRKQLNKLKTNVQSAGGYVTKILKTPVGWPILGPAIRFGVMKRNIH